MAIPGNVLSVPDVLGPLLPPRDQEKEPLSSLHRGGINREDISQGVNYQNWRAFMNGDDVMMIGLTSGFEHLLFTLPGIAEIDLAFDQLMHPYIALRLSTGECQMWWWNPQAAATEFYALPNGSTHPRIVLDDVRYTQTPASDVLLFYILNNSLMMRRQRDRYTVEFLLRENVASLNRVGMGNNLRLQFVA